MFLTIDHIGVAVHDLEAAAAKFKEILGISEAARENVEDQQLIAALLPTADVRFELLQPTDPESVVGRFLERRGEGIHHICFEVSDIQDEIDSLTGREVQLIQGAPREGFVGLVEFVHPRAAAGVLVEFAQVSRRTPTIMDLNMGYVTVAAKNAGESADTWKRSFSMVDSAETGFSSSPANFARVRGLCISDSSTTDTVKFAQPLASQGPIFDYIENRGEGVYSITLISSNLEEVPFVKATRGNTFIPPERLAGVRVVLERARRGGR